MSRTFKALQKAEKDRDSSGSPSVVETAPIENDLPSYKPDLSPPSGLFRERSTELDRKIKQETGLSSFSIAVTALGMNERAAQATLDTAMAWVLELRRKVLLADACFQAPILHRLCGVSREMGLSELARGEEGVIDTIRIDGTTEHLHFISAGTETDPTQDPEKMEKLGAWFAQAKNVYDRIILYAGPVQDCRRILSLADWFDGIVPMVPLKTPPGKARKIIQGLERSGAGILGLVVLG